MKTVIIDQQPDFLPSPASPLEIMAGRARMAAIIAASGKLRPMTAFGSHFPIPQLPWPNHSFKGDSDVQS